MISSCRRRARIIITTQSIINARIRRNDRITRAKGGGGGESWRTSYGFASFRVFAHYNVHIMITRANRAIPYARHERKSDKYRFMLAIVVWLVVGHPDSVGRRANRENPTPRLVIIINSYSLPLVRDVLLLFYFFPLVFLRFYVHAVWAGEPFNRCVLVRICIINTYIYI